jgi:DNA-binding response OmpR family regulator
MCKISSCGNVPELWERFSRDPTFDTVNAPFAVAFPEQRQRHFETDLQHASARQSHLLPMRILVVEDDQLVGDAVRRAVTLAGYAADHVSTAERAKAALHAEGFDLAIIDVGLPGEDGLALVRDLRRRGRNLPVLMLTARDGLSDRVSALDLGADDYLTKPFQVAELLARCRALVRRANGIASSRLSFGGLTLDLARKEVANDGVPLDLTRREWSILECLVLNAGHVVSKERLLSAIASWSEELTPNAVEVYVSRLRAKLGAAAVIRVVRGLGYRLDDCGG